MVTHADGQPVEPVEVDVARVGMGERYDVVDNGTGRGPLKDTVIVEPTQQLSIDRLADNPGAWAFHCHNVYHAETGMMRVLKIESRARRRILW